jgi:hypothetical protein
MPARPQWALDRDTRHGVISWITHAGVPLSAHPSGRTMTGRCRTREARHSRTLEELVCDQNQGSDAICAQGKTIGHHAPGDSLRIRNELQPRGAEVGARDPGWNCAHAFSFATTRQHRWRNGDTTRRCTWADSRRSRPCRLWTCSPDLRKQKKTRPCEHSDGAWSNRSERALLSMAALRDQDVKAREPAEATYNQAQTG